MKTPPPQNRQFQKKWNDNIWIQSEIRTISSHLGSLAIIPSSQPLEWNTISRNSLKNTKIMQGPCLGSFEKLRNNWLIMCQMMPLQTRTTVLSYCCISLLNHYQKDWKRYQWDGRINEALLILIRNSVKTWRDKIWIQIMKGMNQTCWW